MIWLRQLDKLHKGTYLIVSSKINTKLGIISRGLVDFISLFSRWPVFILPEKYITLLVTTTKYIIVINHHTSTLSAAMCENGVSVSQSMYCEASTGVPPNVIMVINNKHFTYYFNSKNILTIFLSTATWLVLSWILYK